MRRRILIFRHKAKKITHLARARAKDKSERERKIWIFSLVAFLAKPLGHILFYMPLLYKMTLAGILKGFAGSAAIEFPSEAALARARQVTYGIR